MFWKFIAEGSEQGVSEGSEGGIVGAKLKALLAMFTLTGTRTTMNRKRTNLKRVTLLHEEAE
jgi:hypothetical protein